MIAPRYSLTDRAHHGSDPSSHVLLSHVPPGVRCRGEHCSCEADAMLDGEPLCAGHLLGDFGIDLAAVADDEELAAIREAVGEIRRAG